MGLKTDRGLLISETFYWDLSDRTRAFTKRILTKSDGSYPSSLHASACAGVTHYLRTADSIGAAEAKCSGRATVAAMKRLPTDDDCFGAVNIRS